MEANCIVAYKAEIGTEQQNSVFGIWVKEIV